MAARRRDTSPFHGASFLDLAMITADTHGRTRDMTAYRTHLAKRDCVQDCPVPSCAGIECAGNEICVFTAQTCQACPTASCVSLDGVGPATSSAVSGTDSPAATSSNDAKGRSSGHSFPAGALASVIVVGVLLLLALISLFVWVRRRRRNIAIGALADSKECGGDEEQSDTKSLSRAASGSVCIALDKSIRQQATSSIAPSEGRSLIAMSEALRRSPSQAHTLPICLDEESLRRAKSTLSGCADLAGVDGNKHFFDADELMRMSYAASHASMVSSAPNTLSRHFSNGTNRSVVHRSPSTGTTAAGADNEAAIIQANKQIMAVRAKANVVQLTKLTSPTSPTTDPASLPGSALPSSAPAATEGGLSKARCVPMAINTSTAAIVTVAPRAKRTSLPQRTSSIQRPRDNAPVRQSLGAGLARSNSTASAAALYNTASFLDFDTDSIVESPIERDYILLTPRTSSNALSPTHSHSHSHSHSHGGSTSHARNGSALAGGCGGGGAAGVVGVPSPLRGAGPRPAAAAAAAAAAAGASTIVASTAIASHAIATAAAAAASASAAGSLTGERLDTAASEASAATSTAVTALDSPRHSRYAPSLLDHIDGKPLKDGSVGSAGSSL